MKIFQLISSGGFLGAENVVVELGKELKSLNIENTIGIFENLQNPHTEIVQHAKENNLKVAVFKCGGKVDLKNMNNIRQYVKKNRINIMHTHGYKSNVYGFLVSRLLKKPIVSTCHNWIANDLMTKTYYRLDKYLLQRFNKVVPVSEEIERELLRNKVKGERISLIYNGINASRFEQSNKNLRREFNIGEKTKVIGTVARFTQEKGLFHLLEVAEKILNLCSNVIFLFVGYGQLKNDLIKKSKELGIGEKIIFTGQRNDLPDIYSIIDIFVLPSLREGLPMVLLEAMAAKKPIIATKVGAIPRVIENRKDGILIDPGSVDAMKEAIFWLLTNEEFSKNISMNAFNKVAKEFSSRKMCSRYVTIYESLLKENFKAFIR